MLIFKIYFSILRGAFARNTVLRVLSMSHNKIRKLDSNSFRGMRFIRRLYLSDNQITDVGRGTFGAITRVGTIDLARNQLKKIDYQMFHQLQYVEVRKNVILVTLYRLNNLLRFFFLISSKNKKFLSADSV